MLKDMIPVWNVHGLDDAETELRNRTSNGLERYNRHMAEIFPNSHPSLVVFVAKLKEEVDRVLQRIENVKKGRENPPLYKAVTFPEIPDDFEDFMPRLYGKGKKKVQGGNKKAQGKKKK